MNQPSAAPPKPALGVQDILFILFRHKWKIIFFSLIGFGVATFLWVSHDTIYSSQVKLLIRYVMESRIESGAGSPDVVRDPEARGSTIISSEIEILSSALLETTELVTPARILEAYGGGTNVQQAAQLLKSGLRSSSGRGSSVLTVTLGHRDPIIAQEALKTLTTRYLKRHFEVHRSLGSFDFLESQTQILKNRLAQTDEEIRRALDTAGIISVAQARAEIEERATDLRKAIYEAEIQLAEHQANMELARNSSSRMSETNTNSTTSSLTTVASSSPVSLTPLEIAAAQRYYQQLANFRNQEVDSMMTFGPNSKPLQQIRRQIAQAEDSLKNLGLDPLNMPAFLSGGSSTSGAAPRPVNPERRLQDLQIRLSVLRNDATNLFARNQALNKLGNRINSLQLTKERDAENYKYFYSNLERARIDQTIDATKLSNITVLQEAMPIGQDSAKKAKASGVALAAGVGFGLLLAFLTELFIDQTYKRSKELESSVRSPLFVSVPRFAANGRAKLKGKKNGALSLLGNGEIAPWDENDPALAYYETLRDRVVMSYNGDLHKPKVVGLTSCNKGAGVTRLAAGLAAALSRDVERSVLFIGMQKNKISFTAFAKGNPVSIPGCQIEPDQQKRTPALVDKSAAGKNATGKSAKQLSGNGVESPIGAESSILEVQAQPLDVVHENLQSLATHGRNLAGASIVQSFCDLMPQLKVSNYDYIVFDLPPISETSGALRLATQMERTLLVVEAEKTSKSEVQRVEKFLTASRANVATIFNKTKSYGPAIS